MEYGITSDMGRVRLENQDKASYFTKGNYVLLILCDGMGGHYGGGIASRTTINTFNKAFNNSIPAENSEIKDYVSWFKKTVDASRDEMIKISANDEAKLDMGTTVTAALLNTKTRLLLIFNIGDSRTYAMTTFGELKQITVDHNLYNKLINEEGKSPYEAKLNRFHASLTSALGPDKRTKIEVFDLSSQYEHVYSLLVTSDGVHDFIEKPKMEMILRENLNAEDMTKKLVEEALDNKSTDNCSAGMVVLDNLKEWS